MARKKRTSPDPVSTNTTTVGVPPAAIQPPYALTIPEILTHCLKNLSKKDLLKAALTCKQWSLWSRDTLWKTHEVPLSVLLRRLDFLFEQSDCFMFLGLDAEDLPAIISPGDWHHFLDFYLRKISSMHIDAGLSSTALHLLQKLSAMHGGGLLCPNLRSLHITMNPLWKSTIPAISLFAPVECLTTLTLRDPHSGKQLTALAAKVAELAPQIRQLTLGERKLSDKQLLTLDCSLFRQLREVHLHDISLASWDALDGCGIESIYLSGNCPDHPNTGEGYNQVTLTALRKLHISTGTIDRSLVLHTIMPTLHTLDIAPKVVARSEAGADFTVAIAQRCSELQEMCLNLSGSAVGDEMMEALVSLKHLTVLRLGGDIQAVSFTNHAIDFLAISIPHLQVLCLAFDTDGAAHSGVTEKGLISLLQHCRVLQELEISVNLSNYPHKSPTLPCQPGQAMKRLTLRRPQLPNDVRRAARFLCACYPHVRVFNVVKSGSPKQTNSLIKEFRRRQGKLK